MTSQGHALVLEAGTSKDFRMSEAVGRKGQKKTVLSLAVSKKMSVFVETCQVMAAHSTDLCFPFLTCTSLRFSVVLSFLWLVGWLGHSHRARQPVLSPFPFPYRPHHAAFSPCYLCKTDTIQVPCQV